MLIVTGCGRSGTKFTSRLFFLEHEPRNEDFKAFFKCFKDKDLSGEYVRQNFTGHERESNSLLAVHVGAIKRLFPKATIIHLIRNPIDSVLSFMSAELYDKDSKITRHHIRLLDNNIWRELSRFERCCHYWVEINKMVRLEGVPHLRLEDLGGEPINVGTKEFTRDNLSKKDHDTCREICGNEAKEYGYEI